MLGVLLHNLLKIEIRSSGVGTLLFQPRGCSWENLCHTGLPAGEHSSPSTAAGREERPGLVGGQSVSWRQAPPAGHPSASPGDLEV